MIKVGKITMGICSTNCYFLYKEGTNRVLFIDPAEQGATIYQKLQDAGFEVAAILLTHGHFDHIWGVEELQKRSGAKVYAYGDEQELMGNPEMNLSARFGRECTADADVYLRDGEKVTIEDMTFEVIHTPGHTSGSCCYYFEADKILVSGDTLFLESVGRSDFPTGSAGTLVRSIREKLLCLPEEVKVYPGHGPTTSMGHEAKYNPFIS